MILETVRSEGLAQMSYFLADEHAGVAAVIDPRRDVDPYLALARHHAVRITHVIETHAHEDFVSGSRELAAQAGAEVCTGPTHEYHYDHRTLTDGERVSVGELELKVLHTPGHTPEHICLLVSGGRGAPAPWGLFSGDTLLPSEIGRTDLQGGERMETATRDLYHSLFDKLLLLEDGVEVFPLHAKGSPCGADIGDRATTTIGYEKRHNPKLQSVSERTFLEKELGALEPVPDYFPRVREKNVIGPNLIGCRDEVPALHPRRFELEKGRPQTVVLDTRPMEAFGAAHVPGALNIALEETFPIWVGTMVRPEQRVLLVLKDERDLDPVQRHLLRIGYEHLIGFLGGGMTAWFDAGLPLDRIMQMSVHELKDLVISDVEVEGLQLLDVRTEAEWRTGHIPTARHLYLPHLRHRLAELRRDAPIATYCSTGFRASIAASFLQQNGFTAVYNVPGSMSAWRAAGYPIEQ